MKVTITRALGMTGFLETLSADTESVTPDHAATLLAHVRDADLFGLRTRAGQATHADATSYEFTIEDAGRVHRILATEAELPSELRSLIALVQRIPGHQKRIEPPGGDRPG